MSKTAINILQDALLEIKEIISKYDPYSEYGEFRDEFPTEEIERVIQQALSESNRASLEI